MFSKKKTEETHYCIAIFTERELINEEYDYQSNKIMDVAEEKIVMVTEMSLTDEIKEEVTNRLPGIKIDLPSYGVFKFDGKKLEEETKKMEKKFKWKKFFNNIPLDEYLIVEHEVAYDPGQICYFTTDMDSLITFLKEESHGEQAL
ncbi:hypothetical protein D3H55_00935 [Bacillus salacetis]|uniref:Uncharacterized protein n=1 Tax=Bacillus salacetis TaxID=2315464 RepID=A0A3A1R6U4_9BACI|nr:hypothetical protein [Bacillus salacetis]RIW38948.1 hypothetical protein D3H55_00935 [Bacillus salacetis]